MSDAGHELTTLGRSHRTAHCGYMDRDLEGARSPRLERCGASKKSERFQEHFAGLPHPWTCQKKSSDVFVYSAQDSLSAVGD